MAASLSKLRRLALDNGNELRERELAADMELGAAWRRAQEALPPHAAGMSVGNARGRHQSSDEGCYAHIITAWEPEVGAYGPTPASALDALTARLRERPA